MEETSLSTRYDASLVETKWYEAWEKAGLFKPDPDPNKAVFVITIPPPNITGSLHMGHALCYPLQDWAGRFRRLMGDSVLILPGQDHAGIATQSVVDKLLRKEGQSAAKLGRERFVARVWEWRKESGGTILRQLRSLGCAFDWSRERFTLDPAYERAVLKAFIEWFDRGLIYKGKRVVNWDPALQTSVSDIETERKTVRGKLFHVKYAFADGSGHITIATTRPETMLGDVAVAVNDKDARYKKLVGKTVILPLLKREIPIVADPYPDPEFGTGAVKVTPAHDPNDYEIGQRHNLPMPVIMDAKGRITKEGGPYEGLDRFEARKRIIADLEAEGLLEKVEDYDIPLLVSERSGEPIEPLLSEQWFVKQKELAQPAIEVVRDGRIRFTPERYNRVYLEWMENIRDWCVSRQLWWGHRIPVYYAEDGQAVAALSKEEAEKKAGKKVVRQEEDVLDTWFSSGLWPFATLGWPEDTPDLKKFYPTSALITDRNIINLWVARMIMMGLAFMKKFPFSQVFIYATVLNEAGQRMSKSLGTGIDPSELIKSHGADALRYALQSQTGENQDIRFGTRRIDEARNFCNKIWNATRFVLMNVGEPPPGPDEVQLQDADAWLLTRLLETERTVRSAYERYHLQEAAQTLHRFFWSELCDWYIELSKTRLAQGDVAPRSVLVYAIEAFLKMLHPIMPHMTEELYQHLPLRKREPFLMSSSWPKIPESFANAKASEAVGDAFELTRALRALRQEAGLSPLKEAPVAYFESEKAVRFEPELVRSQAWFGELKRGRPPAGVMHISTSALGIDLHLPIDGLVDKDREIARLTKERDALQTEKAGLDGRLFDKAFVERAKPEVVEKSRQRSAEIEERLAKIDERVRMFRQKG